MATKNSLSVLVFLSLLPKSFINIVWGIRCVRSYEINDDESNFACSSRSIYCPAGEVNDFSSQMKKHVIEKLQESEEELNS